METKIKDKTAKTWIESINLRWTSLFGSLGLVTHGYGHAVQEIGGSNPSCDNIVGVFHPTKQLARFSPPNMSYIENSKCI